MIELIRHEASHSDTTRQRLTVAAMCRVLGITRAQAYRRHSRKVRPHAEAVREAVKQVAAEMPVYGYRRVYAEVRRRAYSIGHYRVRRILREAHLQCRRPKRFRGTTDSRHDFHVYPNLARLVQPSRINQLWVADITYVQLPKGFLLLGSHPRRL